MNLKRSLRKGRLGFYVLALVITAAVLAFQGYMDNRSESQPNLPGVVSGQSLNESNPFPESQQKAIDLYSTMSGLLITLATALLGGLGYLLMNGRQRNPFMEHGVSAVGSASLAVLSLYFGYVCHLHALWFTYHATFRPTVRAISWPRHAQFYTLLAALFFFADFAFHELGKEQLSGNA